MDSEILEQLKNIGQQLEKITKLLEEKKSFPPKKSFGDRKPFNKDGRKDFDRRPGGPREPRFQESRFNADGKPRIIADGRKFGRRNRF